MTGRLDGRVAIITGAARGQGETTARIFAAEGAQVVVADMLMEEGEAVASSIGEASMFQKLDVTDEAAWVRLVKAVVARWGGVDILINNAGIVHPASLLELKKADFQRVLDINLLGAWLGMKTVAPQMIGRGKGAIVNICSTSALFGMNGLSAYLASKWALRGLSKTAALELGRKGVRVNAVFPGGINTVMASATKDPSLNYYRNQPLMRIGEPEEVARTSLFLVSDDASYLCGAELAVDGGMTIGQYNDFLPGMD